MSYRELLQRAVLLPMYWLLQQAVFLSMYWLLQRAVLLLKKLTDVIFEHYAHMGCYNEQFYSLKLSDAILYQYMIYKPCNRQCGCHFTARALQRLYYKKKTLDL